VTSCDISCRKGEETFIINVIIIIYHLIQEQYVFDTVVMVISNFAVFQGKVNHDK